MRPGASDGIDLGAFSNAEPDDPTPVTAPPAPPPPPPSAAPDNRSARVPRWLLIAIIAVVLLIVLAILGATLIGRFATDGTDQAGRTGPGGSAHTVTAPLGQQREGVFELVTGATTVAVRTTDLNDDLYRISTPDNSAVVPRVVNSAGRIQLHLAKVEGDGTSAVEVRLNSRVRWGVQLTGGSASATVDLRDANLAAVDFTGGSTRIEIWLPRPNGRVVARMAGGAAQFAVHAPTGIPVRVRIGGGAATVAVDNHTRSGIAPGTVIAPDGFDQAADRYDVDATAGVANLAVDRY